MSNSLKIKYKGLPLPDACPDVDIIAEKLLDRIILESDIPYSQEKVEEELRAEVGGFLQNMRYRAMAGDHQLEEIDLDEWKESIRKDIIRDCRIEKILCTVIEQEHLSVSDEELKEAAVMLAEKEQTSLEMVRWFMGEDYGMLRKDVLYKKAKDFIVSASVDKKS